MKATIKYFHSPDIDDIQLYDPEEKSCFGFLLQVVVGPSDSEGEEAFDIQICTPYWLLEKYGPEDVVIGRSFLIVQEYDYNRIIGKIIAYCERCEGENWQEIATKMSWLGKWEFEDYSP